MQNNTTQPNIKKHKISLPNYTLGEELFSSITHGVGSLLGLIGMILLLIKADSTIEYVSASVFGIAMILLYTTSCIYHGLAKNGGKRVMRVMDHCMIYLLIVGTYAPFCLITMHGLGGVWYFLANCTLATLGITFTAIDLKKFSKLGMVCYLGMGWLVIFASVRLQSALGTMGFALLLAGGIAYTLGAIVYGIGSKMKYFHSIWHLFVMLGSFLHYLAIYLYVF